MEEQARPHDLRAKKSLGQNFLKSKAALRSIVGAASLSPEDRVLEVGPGKGVLTEALTEKAGSVLAVEKDDRMIPFLEEKFSTAIAHKKLQLVHGDILEFDPNAHNLAAGKYKMIANIPYYITGQLLRTFLETGPQPSKMVLMLQKEVAKRIVARDGKESILSVSVKAYGTPKYIETVPAKYFSPEPNVDSAILLIDNISKSFFADMPGISEQDFFEIVKKGFLHKRKVLVQNLEIPADKREKIWNECGLDIKVRAEDVPIEQWKRLVISIKTHN